MLVRPGASGPLGLDWVLVEPRGLFKLQPMEGDGLVGSCMAGASGSVKPRARGLRQCSGFHKVFCCHPSPGRAGLWTGRAERLCVSACAPVQPLLADGISLPAPPQWLNPPQPHTQRCPRLCVPQPSTISRKPLPHNPGAAVSGCTHIPPRPCSAPRDTIASSPAPQPGNKPSWCHNTLVPSRLSPGPLTSSEEAPLSRVR